MKYTIRFSFLITAICINFFPVKAELPKSGYPLKSTTSDSIGIMSPPGINATPIGAVFLKDNKLPSIFLAADSRYTGIYRYDCLMYKNGIPVFGEPAKVIMPSELGYLLSGSMFEHKNIIYAYWLKGNNIIETIYDEKENSFSITRKITLKSLPRTARSFSISLIDNRLEGFLEIGDGVPSNAPVHWLKGKNFAAYGPDGIFVGNLTYSGIYGFTTSFTNPELEVETQPVTGLKEVMWGYNKIVRILYGNNQQGLLTGSVNGNFLYYPLKKEILSVSEKHLAVDQNNNAIRHATIGARPIALGDKSGKHIGLIVGGEGGIFFYPYLRMTKNLIPMYGVAKNVLAYNPDLYGGSLIVPNLVDWNSDGKFDLVVGNSAGNILYFENKGNNFRPVYSYPKKLCAGGEEIHMQPGYNDDIQGPYESRWGYVSPTVVDWNNDGLLDIISNDSRGKHRLFLNIGTKKEPKLAAESPLYLDGLELHGTWRTRPGVAKMGDKMAYVTQDDQDQFHIYWQLDTYNLIDGGKLCLEDGSYIDGSYFPNGGGSGRNKFLIVDWDGDGIKDLLVGTARHSSIPKKDSGMPYFYGDKGATVLFMKNIGTENNPKYAFPKMIKYKGETIHFGQHECAPTVGNLGISNGLDLIVGNETGRFFFYERSDLTW